MRKTWAEYKREQRKREREARRSLPDVAQNHFTEPFFEYFAKYGGDVNWGAAALGSNWALYNDDSGIEPEHEDALVDETIAIASNSLGKAELVIDLLIDTAGELSRIVNDYKRSAIDARISKIEQLAPNEKRQALDELEHLKKIRYQLNKQVRHGFQQWKVTGE